MTVLTDNTEDGPFQVWGPNGYTNIFGDYTLQPGIHNGHVWYLKDDNKDIKMYAAQYGRFHICPTSTPYDMNTGWAYSTDVEPDCAEETGFSWKYWNPDTEIWLDAGSNIQVLGHRNA